MEDNNNNNYEVGYKRPPTEHQFKPGHSGNAKGRPKLIKEFKTDLREELEEIIIVQEGGKSKPITKQRALIKKLIFKALGGELGAQKALTSLIAFHLDDTTSEVKDLSVEDQKLLDKYIYKNGKEKKQ
ncbi:MAG: DUF5681 domain-containing protein [Candidatus Gastranaerophilales bacterium]|nr:DUF5681 domain-containing protein [Candidatus Gastranaerophilales bacterium]